MAHAVSRQLQALDKCLGLLSHADAKLGKPVASVTVPAVKVAQNSAAAALEAVKAEGHAWLLGLLQPNASKGKSGSKCALRMVNE